MNDDEVLGRTRLATNNLRGSPSSLQLPRGPRGRGVSRSPSPTALGGAAFEFEPPAATNQIDADHFVDASPTFEMPDISIEELQRVAKTASDAAAAAAAALNAMTTQLQATTAANAQLRSSKKPDLPAFDAKNIEIWIRRIESAYIRAGVTTTKEKFAFLETKLPVDLNPKINEFLFGDLDPDPWEPFLDYLRKEYGRTIQQRTSTAIEGVKRDGRKPSQLAALMTELTREVTLDDILKEHLLREMPMDVRRAIARDAKGLNLEATAALADDYFGQDGRPLFTSPTSTINAVDPSPAPKSQPSVPLPAAEGQSNDSESTNRQTFTSAFNGSQEPVNAVSRPTARQPHRPSQNTGRNPSRGPPNPSQRTSSRPNAPGVRQQFQQFDANGHCSYHVQFGTKARQCRPGCTYPASGNGQAPRQK